MSLKVVQVGCGPVGCSIVRLILQKANLKLLGAVDLVNAGRDLGDVAGLGKKLGIIISEDASTVLGEAKPDCVLHATGSNLDSVYPQLEKIIESGSNIVTTCEELSYPYRKYPKLAANIDKLAKSHRVTVLATGVNPGFLMDTWPLFMTAVCQDVTQVRVVRRQDASSRRVPFQKKIGAGKTIEEFNKLIEAGTLKHVGLAESIAMIAAGLGWELNNITETIEPVILDNEVSSDFVIVKPGQAAGVKQVGYGWKDGKKLITLDFQAHIGAEESYDTVYITGTPNMEVTIKGGTHGDLATAAIVVNSVPRVIDASPGLITMKDLPIVCASP